MTQSGHGVANIGITASASIGGEALCSAGGLGHNGSVLVLAGGGDDLGVGLAAGAGVHGLAFLHAGRLISHDGVLMAQSGDGLGVSITASAGVDLAAGLGAGGGSHHGAVLMAGGLQHFRSLLTADGAGGGDGTVGGAGGLHGDGLVAVAGSGDDLGVSITAGAGVDLAALDGAGRSGLHNSVAVAQSSHGVAGVAVTAGAGIGGVTILGAGGSGGHSGVAVGVGILVGLHKDGQPVVLAAHCRGRKGLELAVGVANRIVVVGAGTADSQHLLAALGLQTPVSVVGGREGGHGGDVSAAAAGSRTGRTQVSAGLGVGHGELAVLGGGSPCQRLVVVDDVSAVAVGLDGDGHGSGIAAHGVGVHAGSVIAVVHQHVLLAGGDSGGLTPDLTALHGSLGFHGSLGLLGFGIDRSLGLLGFGIDGGLGGGGGGSVVAGNLHVVRMGTGILAGGAVILEHQCISVDHNGGSNTLAGRILTVGIDVAGVHVSEVGDNGGATLNAHGFRAVLCHIVTVGVGGAFAGVVVTPEENDIHLLCSGRNGVVPGSSALVVTSAGVQGHMGDDEHRLAAVCRGGPIGEASRSGRSRRIVLHI